HMPGFKSYQDLPTYYGLAGAFVLPSESEQWGLVVNEAMAAGVPVIVSDRCGSAPELVQDGWNGFTFPVGDSKRLADLLLRVARQCDVPEMGRRARERIAAWSPERFAAGLSSAVAAALNHPVPRRRVTHLLLIRALVAMQESHLPNEV